MVNKEDHPQIALIQVGEVLKITQINEGKTIINHIKTVKWYNIIITIIWYIMGLLVETDKGVKQS